MNRVSLGRLYAIARKEWIHIIRDWRSLLLAIAIPAVLILLFGYALNMDLKEVPTVVWDQTGTPESREFLSLFDGSPYFSIRHYRQDYASIQEDLDKGRAMVAVVVPGDFARRVLLGDPVDVQVIVDGSDANTARLVVSYAMSVGMIHSRSVGVKKMELMGAGELVQPVELEPRAWYNADLKSQNVIVPGIIAVVMMVVAAMMASVTVAREWETGTMEQLVSTPVRVPELVLGKVIPYFILGLLDVAIAVAMGRWLFDVPLRGSPGLLFASASLFLTGALFFGMTVGIVMKTQVLSTQIAMIAGFLPTTLLSGFVFAIENMPVPIQIITYVVPARYFIALLKGIYLKGIGLEILWLNALLLGVYAAVMVILAMRKLKLRLE
ncbi:MAG: ABC transporter permease [Desulfomonilia bacterium]